MDIWCNGQNIETAVSMMPTDTDIAQSQIVDQTVVYARLQKSETHSLSAHSADDIMTLTTLLCPIPARRGSSWMTGPKRISPWDSTTAA